jgi:hypothetical protein
MARLASFKMEAEEDFDATRWLDRALIRLAQVEADVQVQAKSQLHFTTPVVVHVVQCVGRRCSNGGLYM